VRVWTGFSWLSIEPSGGFSEHGAETSGSRKGCGFIYQLSENKFLKKDSAPYS